jgi:hypothetical protein
MRGVNKEPTSFENWVFDKVFLPLAILTFVFVGLPLIYDSISFRNSCSDLCLEKGYLSFKVLKLKFEPKKCYCYLTEDKMTKGAYETRVQVQPKT